MILVIWEFQVDPSNVVEFEKNYGPQGTWVALLKWWFLMH